MTTSMTTSMGTSETICAVATPPGEGAVGLIRISGPAALTLLRGVCRRRRFTPRALHPVTLRRGDEVLDRALVCFMPGPRSFTGEDVVEVHGHGGALNMERLLTLFVERGARLAHPGEFTRRAFLNGRLDLTQAEAVGQVIAARSERALKNAQALLAGALGRRIRTIRGQLVEAAAELEARVDFADDLDLDDLDNLDNLDDLDGLDNLDNLDSGLLARLEAAGEALARLAGSFEEGRKLDGVTVALVGPVNAGKSSLFNRLLGSQRALVSEEPGTTRDYLEAEVSWEGHRITLVDTAGERAPETLSPLERAGRELSRPVIERCHLLLHVVDLQQLDAAGRPNPYPEPRAGRLVVANKLDRVARVAPPPEHVVLTSALEGTGLETLRQRVLQLFPAEGAEQVMVTRRRQWEALRRAAQALEEAHGALAASLPPELVAEHVKAALGALGELTGQRFTDEVLDQIFSTFCIGK